MSRNHNAVARATYTGEPYGQALTFVRTHGLIEGLVPDATGDQQLFEAILLWILACGVGAHRPTDLAGAPYGIGYVSPSPNDLRLVPDEPMLRTIVNCLLPHQTLDGAVGGVPGLRLQTGRFQTRRRSVILSWHGTPATIVVPDSGAWTAAAQDLAASPGIRALWREPTPATAERAAADHLRQRLRSTAAGWSTVLRRIHLFARHRYLDFVTGLPHAEEVAGPAAHRLTPRPVPPRPAAPRPAVVLACASPRGGEGKTTIAGNLAAALARQGARVVAVDCDPHAWLVRLFGADTAPARSRTQPWTVVEQIPGAGLVAVAAAPVGDTGRRSQLRALRDVVRAARARFDFIILDSPPADAAHAVAAEADGVIVPVTLGTNTVTQTPAEERVATAKDHMYAWLDTAFEERLDALPDEDFPDDDATPADDDSWYDAQRTAFLRSIAAAARAQWGDTWRRHHSAWMDHHRRVDDPDVDTVRSPRSPGQIARIIADRIPVIAADRRARVIGFVLNRANAERLPEDPMGKAFDILAAQGMPVLETRIPQSHAYMVAMDEGTPTVLRDPDSLISRRFLALADDVLARCRSTSSQLL